MTQPLGIPKREFLESVRRSLRRAPGPPESPHPGLNDALADLEAEAADAHRRLAEARPELMDRLAEVAALRDWRVHRADGPEEAIGYVSSLTAKMGITQCVRSDQAVFEEVPMDAPLTAQGVAITAAAAGGGTTRESVRARIAAAGLGITGADYAIAETGSVILTPSRGLSRLVSVVPPIHVALVRPQDVIESIDDLLLFRRLEYGRGGGDMGSYLNFITGPSRTADIEQTLVVGVHGPKEVHMILLG